MRRQPLRLLDGGIVAEQLGRSRLDLHDPDFGRLGIALNRILGNGIEHMRPGLVGHPIGGPRSFDEEPMLVNHSSRSKLS